ncbi:hypothetical protein BDZ45DRAFT_743992 [Acephala macrosclerotiorum]|nr:hypothetical protein BDZ45DRAFT_743992 [Acephala macrosclerotiorum]
MNRRAQPAVARKPGGHSSLSSIAEENLTYETDKLPALAGLAREIVNKTGDTYLAGLWKNTVLEGVLWRTYLREEVEVFHDDSLSPRLASWASVDASIRFETINPDHLVAQYIHSYLEPTGMDIYGGLKSGWLSIRDKVLIKDSLLNPAVVWISVQVGEVSRAEGQRIVDEVEEALIKADLPNVEVEMMESKGCWEDPSR